MNKKTTFISLALVTLLASCGSKSAQGQLKECSRDIARKTAASILTYRAAKYSTLTGEDAENPFYSGQLLSPVEAKQFNAEITMKEYTNTVDSTDETIVTKTFNIDLEKGIFNCKISQTRETNSGAKYSFPDINYYGFFNEYEKQDEDITSNWDKEGDTYLLANISGQNKIGLYKANITKKDSYNYFKDFLLVDSYSINSAILNVPQLTNVMYYPDFINDDMLEYTGDTEWTDFASDDSLTLNVLLNSFEDFDSALQTTAEGLKEEFNRDDTYLKVRYGSNDLESLSFDVDYNKYLNDFSYMGRTVTDGNASEKVSVTFRNQFLTESHYSYKFHVSKAKQPISGADPIEISVDMNQNIQVDQKVNYGSCSCSVPTDIDQYLLFFPN